MKPRFKPAAPELDSSPEYKTLPPSKKKLIVNGAGAAGEWISCFIPNTMYGLDVEECFNIHDYDYHVGRSWAEKYLADSRMLRNLLKVINWKGGLLAFLRRRRALKYYEAVHLGGDEAFWKGKNG